MNRAVSFVYGALCVAIGYAAPPKPEPAKLQALLQAGNFAQLDAELSAYQNAYRAGEINDDAAATPFVVLVRNEPDLKPQYDKWVTEKPDSYVARVARGYYLMQLGYQARGTAYASQTSGAQIQAMRAHFAAAMVDLEMALKLDTKPVLQYGTMIAIADGVGDDQAATRYLDEAIATDPRAFVPRLTYLRHLQPEWGGSIERMEQAVAAWKGSLEEKQVKHLEAIVEDSRWRQRLQPGASLFEAKQYQQAIEFYSEALKEKPVLRAYAMRAASYSRLGQYDKAIADYDRVLEINPTGGCCTGSRSGRAYAYLKLGQKEKALEDLVLAGEADDEWAARELARIYAFGQYGFKPDYSTAYYWCERAAKRGDGVSMYCMGSLYHAGLGTTKNPGLAAKWFTGAAERGVADAQADLGFVLWDGTGVPQDREAAVKWWRAAARQGNARARGQLEGRLTGWEYFVKVRYADWADEAKNPRRGPTLLGELFGTMIMLTLGLFALEILLFFAGVATVLRRAASATSILVVAMSVCAVAAVVFPALMAASAVMNEAPVPWPYLVILFGAPLMPFATFALARTRQA